MTFLAMGETDYKDEEWTDKDWEELRQAGDELERKRAREREAAKAREPATKQ